MTSFKYFIESIGNKYYKALSNMVFAFSILIMVSIFIDFQELSYYKSNFKFLSKTLHIVFALCNLVLNLFLFVISKKKYYRLFRAVFLFLSIIYLLSSILYLIAPVWMNEGLISTNIILALLLSFIGMSFKIANISDSSVHPSALFVLSFLILILLGTVLLLLPASSKEGITIIEALFTATSAVTVTGLAVLDTGKDFTFFGQTVIIILIQLGGLGVLTITNIFALLFNTSNSFKNRMVVGEMIKELDNRNTFTTLFKIIFLTILVEIIGAILIYISIYNNDNLGSSPLFFSIFHSISAFCNGGFSTLTNSLYEETVRYNYFLQIIVAWLIITGGLGYSVMLNHYTLIKSFVRSKIRTITTVPPGYQSVISRTSMNSRLILYTTVILLISGTVVFYLSEYNGVLAEHSFWGKIVVSFFNSTTTRTAGFNNINMGDLGIPAFMITLALMWIGASPGSTGGGIKTTTFAVALLNLWNQIRGKAKLVVNYREVPQVAINQVNAVIMLSIFAISASTFLLSFLNPTLLFQELLFEVISAYSTVGLSVGITSALTEGSKIVLIVVMFLGRVSFLTFLIGLFSSIMTPLKQNPPYYAKENVFIN